MESRLGMSLDQIISSKEINGGRGQQRNNNNKRNVQSNRQGRTRRMGNPYSNSSQTRNNGPNNSSIPDCALKFLLSNGKAGSLIGVGGRAIKELMEITKASVHVSSVQDLYPNYDERVVYITGTESQVSLAQSLVWEMIGQQTFHSSEDSEVWDPAAARDSPGEYDSVDVEGKIAIPAQKGGLILGRGGATIKAIAEESSVTLTMDSKEESDQTMERVLHIRGTAAGCMNCTSLVLTKLLEEGKYSYIVRGTTYPKNLSERIHNNNNNGNNTSRGGGDGDYRPSRGSTRVIQRSMSNSGLAETLSANTIIELAVADHLVGALLGQGGQGLLEMTNLSGAKISISQRGEFVEGTTNRLVTITGSPACAQTAHTLVVHKLKQASEDA